MGCKVHQLNPGSGASMRLMIGPVQCPPRGTTLLVIFRGQTACWRWGMSVTADKVNSSTGQTFLTAFVINAAALGVQLLAFLVLKNRLTRIYGPRTYLPPEECVSIMSFWVMLWCSELWIAREQTLCQEDRGDGYQPYYYRQHRRLWVTFATFLRLDANSYYY